MLESVSARFRTILSNLSEKKSTFEQKAKRALCKSLTAVYSRPQIDIISGN